MNISEIARLAGVSNAAVSRYFNNGYISDEKRERIRKVVEETGYTPSIQARTLRTKKTRMVGVIIPKINSDAISRVVAGISSVTAETEYELLLANTDNQAAKEVEYLKLFNRQRVDGVILIASIFTKNHAKALAKLEVPIVIVGQRQMGYDCIYHDDYHAARELTAALIRDRQPILGYIGVTLQDEAVGRQRQQGFLDALIASRCPFQEGQLATADFNLESGYRCASRMLQDLPALDGLVCATDRIAIGAMMYLKERGQSIPGDIEIAGIGDSQLSRVTSPTLTTVHFSYKTSGMEAAKRLLEMMDGDGGPPKEVKLGYRLIMQGSTR